MSCNKLAPAQPVLSGAAATGAGDAQLVEDFRHVVIHVATDGGATMTVQFQASIMEDEPNWEQSQSQDNKWEYVQVVDLADRSSIDGATGFSVSGSDDNRLFEVNTNLIRWFNARVTGHTGGDVDVDLIARTN